MCFSEILRYFTFGHFILFVRHKLLNKRKSWLQIAMLGPCQHHGSQSQNHPLKTELFAKPAVLCECFQLDNVVTPIMTRAANVRIARCTAVVCCCFDLLKLLWATRSQI